MRKTVLIIFGIIAFIFLTGTAYAEGFINHSEVFDNEEVEFEEMLTTAYNLHGITATGVPTHAGICACNTHLGELAVVYTLEGEYLFTLECCDTGSTDGLVNGYVLDVWFDSMDECREYMAKTQGRCKVQWIKGVG